MQTLIKEHSEYVFYVNSAMDYEGALAFARSTNYCLLVFVMKYFRWYLKSKLPGLTTGLSFQSSISSGTGLDSSSQDRFWHHLPCYGDNCICHNWLASHDIHGIHGWYFYFFAGCLFGGWPCAGQGCKGTGMHYITATVFNKTPNLYLISFGTASPTFCSVCASVKVHINWVPVSTHRQAISI